MIVRVIATVTMLRRERKVVSLHRWPVMIEGGVVKNLLRLEKFTKVVVQSRQEFEFSTCWLFDVLWDSVRENPRNFKSSC